MTEIKALLGSIGQTKTIMGFISQLEDGQYYIEDLSGALKIDMSEAMTAAGFYVGVNLSLLATLLKPMMCIWPGILVLRALPLSKISQ